MTSKGAEMFGEKKYRYVDVRFDNTHKIYAYRTDDGSLKPGNVVVVPTPDGNETALVIRNKKYKESDVPYPLELSKAVVRKARWYERRKYGNAGKSTVYYEMDSLKGKFYRCGLCKSVYVDKHTVCPNCNARWTKCKYDPTFIDEIETFEALFGK